MDDIGDSEFARAENGDESGAIALSSFERHEANESEHDTTRLLSRATIPVGIDAV